MMSKFSLVFYALNRIAVKNASFGRLQNTILEANCVSLNATQSRFAGHSKWQNIRHTKAKTDAAKSKLHMKYANLIRMAARLGGSPDPAVNMKLKAAIDEAKSMSVRKEVIDRALNSARNVKIQPHVLEMQGPGSSFFIVCAETDNVSNLRHDIKKIMKKTKSSFVQPGIARFAFNEAGIIRIEKKDKNGVPLTFEKMEELAIEAGAEEVSSEEVGNDEENNEDKETNELWKVKTAAEDLYTVKHYFEQHASNVEIISAELEFVPTRYVELDDSEAEVAAQFVEQLEEMPEVLKLYNNIK